MRRSVGVLVLVLLGVAAVVEAQMPDLGSMSGTPLPAGDLPNGTVSVRVVRGDLTNNVAGHPVELHGGPQDQRVTTDETGRAVFSNVPAGATVHATTMLDGTSLESQRFAMPESGGVKIMLVGGAVAAGSASAAPAKPSAPPVPGRVVLGGQSRFVVEVTDEGLDVYNLLDIANFASGPVTTEPLVFEVPDGAQGLTVLEGSSPQAAVDGMRFQVRGPFAPGITSVQMAYRLPFSSGHYAFEQVLPVELATTSLIVRKVGAVTFRSPQAASSREMTMEGGNVYFVASGQGLPAGGRLRFELSGLPYHSTVPRYIALGLAVFVIGVGVWLAANGPDAGLAEARRALEAKRAALMDDLVALERERTAGEIDGQKHAARREALLGQLERLYAQLDREGGVSSFAGSHGARPTRPASAHAAR